MKEQQAKLALVQAGKSLFQRGYATGTAGNLSLLLDDGSVLVTPTNSCLGELTVDMLSKVTLNGEHISGNKPSKETKFHLSIYHNNPKCKAIVHLHSLYLTALSCLSDLNMSNAIKPFTPYIIMKVGDLPVVPYYRPGDTRIAEQLAALAPNHKAFLLANHGAVSTGSDLNDAMSSYEELEETAKLIFILKGENIRYLTDHEINELKG